MSFLSLSHWHTLSNHTKFRPHQRWYTTNLTHWLTHSLKLHQNMVWVFFPSLQTLCNHTKVLTTPNDVKQTWHTLSNHTKLWSHQIDVCVQQTKVHCVWPHQYHINVPVWYTSSLTHSTTPTTPNFWPHQIDVHDVQQTSLTDRHSLSNHTKMWYGFSFPHYKLSITTTIFWSHQIDVKRTWLTDWHTLSNHTKLWPHQIDVRAYNKQKYTEHCDHTNIILMFLSDTRHHSLIPPHSITLNIIIVTTYTTTPNLTESHHPPWPIFSSTLPTG
jgi:hypothetical protein